MITKLITILRSKFILNVMIIHLQSVFFIVGYDIMIRLGIKIKENKDIYTNLSNLKPQKLTFATSCANLTLTFFL